MGRTNPNSYTILKHMAGAPAPRPSEAAPASQVQQPIPVEKHFSPNFYAELWSVSTDTVIRWFQDMPGVLKMGNPSSRRRTRCELRIPYHLAMKEYAERSK